MESQEVSKPQPKQPLVARLGFFVLGGVGSTVLNKNILAAAQHFLHWPLAAAYACSVTSTAFIFFLWSYFINFRTARVWKDCLGRYIACQLLALGMNYAIAVCGLKQFGSQGLVGYLVIGTVQSFTGGIKFLLYHYWVFPHVEQAPKPEAAAVS
jgi:putative flippase GtrA